MKRKFDFNIFNLLSLLFNKRHDQFLVLNRIWIGRKVRIFQNIASTTCIIKGVRLQKKKTDFKKKKVPKCRAGCQPLPEKLRFSLPLQPRKMKKSLVLRLGHPPWKMSYVVTRLLASLSVRIIDEKQSLKISKLLLLYCKPLTS